ncbi:hypothetical protein SAMN05216167_11485 [Spirosoma endophyticum]|uniref:Uncharacterized protein n=2 Tax=Spirosoma endophyticum TaxID=662367 RepID=A0A1I2ATI6_9BACT|nr:hypothetical protein SAMN05216167_11485 [Spirosoma endophyticum]
MTLAIAYAHLFNMPAEHTGNTFYHHYFLTVCVVYLAIASLLAVVVLYSVADEDFHIASRQRELRLFHFSLPM